MMYEVQLFRKRALSLPTRRHEFSCLLAANWIVVRFILIKSPDEWVTTKQACIDKLVVYLFFVFFFSQKYVLLYENKILHCCILLSLALANMKSLV